MSRAPLLFISASQSADSLVTVKLEESSNAYTPYVHYELHKHPIFIMNFHLLEIPTT